MEYKEKLDAVLKVINDEYKKGHYKNITLDLSLKNELSQSLSRNEIMATLEKFQSKERIIRIENESYERVYELRRHIIGSTVIPTIVKDPHPNPKHSIFIRILTDDFANWYASYLLRRSQKLEDFDPLHLESIYNIVIQINRRLQIKPNPKVEINPLDINNQLKNLIAETQRYLGQQHIAICNKIALEALEYLQTEEVVKTALVDPNVSNLIITGAIINIDNFLNFHKKITKIMSKDNATPANKTVPPACKWEDITIKFKNGHDVNITIKDKKIRSDFKQMGFEDTKKRLPNQQWELLERLAKNNGEISWNDSEATIKLKKRKQLLSQVLKAYFQIDEDPFFPYKQEKAYKIKINLIPE